YLNLDDIAAKLAQPRQRIMTALDFLAERGDLELKTAGARQCHRVLKRPDDERELARALLERFREREERDITRTHAMFDFPQSPGCLNRRVRGYLAAPR